MDSGKQQSVTRYMIGLASGFLGGWMLWTVGGAILMELNHGQDLMLSLSYPPTMIRLMAALAAFSAGLATLVNFSNAGVWLAGVATFLFSLLAFGLILNGTDVSLWAPNLVYLACLTALFLAMFITRRKRAGS